MEEFFERYGYVGVQEPWDEYDMLPEECDETYGGQFSYEFPLINYTKLLEEAKTPINYYASKN